MKRSELVRQLNLLPDVEVKVLQDLGSIAQGEEISQIYMSVGNDIVINTYYSALVIVNQDQPKPNKFE